MARKGSMGKVFARASKACSGKKKPQFNKCRKAYIKNHS